MCLRIVNRQNSFAVDKVVIKDSYLLVYLLPVGQRSIMVSVSVCLSVYLPPAHLRIHPSNLDQFYARYLRPSLGPHMATVAIRYAFPDHG